jgi:hypothetical protein
VQDLSHGLHLQNDEKSSLGDGGGGTSAMFDVPVTMILFSSRASLAIIVVAVVNNAFVSIQPFLYYIYIETSTSAWENDPESKGSRRIGSMPGLAAHGKQAESVSGGNVRA